MREGAMGAIRQFHAAGEAQMMGSLFSGDRIGGGGGSSVREVASQDQPQSTGDICITCSRGKTCVDFPT